MSASTGSNPILSFLSQQRDNSNVNDPNNLYSQLFTKLQCPITPAALTESLVAFYDKLPNFSSFVGKSFTKEINRALVSTVNMIYLTFFVLAIIGIIVLMILGILPTTLGIMLIILVALILYVMSISIKTLITSSTTSSLNNLSKDLKDTWNVTYNDAILSGINAYMNSIQNSSIVCPPV